MSTPRFGQKSATACRVPSCSRRATQVLIKTPDLDGTPRWLYQIHGAPVACAYHAARIVRGGYPRTVAALERGMGGGPPDG